MNRMFLISLEHVTHQSIRSSSVKNPNQREQLPGVSWLVFQHQRRLVCFDAFAARPLKYRPLVFEQTDRGIDFGKESRIYRSDFYRPSSYEVFIGRRLSRIRHVAVDVCRLLLVDKGYTKCVLRLVENRKFHGWRR